MKKNPTISVVILTNDRPELLEKALVSIKRQTYPPIEVVVVDDSSVLHEETVRVVKKHTKALPIIKRNTEHSISYGRTIGMKASAGDLIVYLDDDCEAEPTYLKRFRDHFLRTPRLTAVIGRIKNALPDNVFAATQYAYYDRGLRRFFPSLDRIEPLTFGRILDCEVMGIRRRDLSALGFTERHRRYRNDDVDLGLRLMQKGKTVLFDPDIIAYASPRTSLIPLWTAAFWNGYSDASTTREYQIDLRAAPYPVSFARWFPKELTGNTHMSGIKKLPYALLLISFPLVSRVGMLWYHLSHPV